MKRGVWTDRLTEINRICPNRWINLNATYGIAGRSSIDPIRAAAAKLGLKVELRHPGIRSEQRTTYLRVVKENPDD